jgi:hypothetical protein
MKLEALVRRVPAAGLAGASKPRRLTINAS